MGDIFTKIKELFLRGDFLIKLILINVSVFLLVRLILTFFTLFQLGNFSFLEYVEVPSSIHLLLYRPWTLLTYMFIHIDFLHILFNMLWLYWFGKIFLLFLNQRQLIGLYVSGGVVASVFFVLAYNLFPYFRNVNETSFLLGASGSVMTLVFSISFYQKNYEVNLLFIGRVKLIYLAWITLVIDLISVTSTNAGGHIAHLGGALFGILFASQYQRGRDLISYINRIIDQMVNWMKPRKPSMRVVYRRSKDDNQPNPQKENESDMLDNILDKLKYSGYDSLSSEEKKTLFDASKK